MVRIPNTDLAPFALCEFCKSMQTRWNGPQGPLITSLSKFRSPPEWCEVRRRVLYKICKKCISRARAPRGRDAWAQTRAEFHMLLRQQCRADYAATDTWRPPANASWAPRWGRRQNRTRAGWASRWRGLACWHEGQVLWHTDDRYPAAAVAQDDRDEDWLEGHD